LTPVDDARPVFDPHVLAALVALLLALVAAVVALVLPPDDKRPGR
jgi:hypothetical protein